MIIVTVLKSIFVNGCEGSSSPSSVSGDPTSNGIFRAELKPYTRNSVFPLEKNPWRPFPACMHVCVCV